jgi:ADP-ribose pyrophosphatase YjhB (NUDIX family)
LARIIRGERVGKLGRIAVGCSAAIIQPQERKILLVRRADNGLWAIPGGYMDPGESVAEACAREVLEETGLSVRVGRLIAVYNRAHVLLEYPDGNRLQLVVMHFAAECLGGVLSTSDVTTQVGYFSYEATASMLMNPFNRLRIDDAFAAQPAAFIRDDFPFYQGAPIVQVAMICWRIREGMYAPFGGECGGSRQVKPILDLQP